MLSEVSFSYVFEVCVPISLRTSKICTRSMAVFHILDTLGAMHACDSYKRFASNIHCRAYMLESGIPLLASDLYPQLVYSF